MNDNDSLVTVAKDRSMRLWKMSQKRKYVEFPRAHEQQINDAFWVNGNTLLTVGLDGCSRVWHVESIQ
jgi:WD40 repeat protein